MQDRIEGLADFVINSPITARKKRRYLNKFHHYAFTLDYINGYSVGWEDLCVLHFDHALDLYRMLRSLRAARWRMTTRRLNERN